MTDQHSQSEVEAREQAFQQWVHDPSRYPCSHSAAHRGEMVPATIERYGAMWCSDACAEHAGEFAMVDGQFRVNEREANSDIWADAWDAACASERAQVAALHEELRAMGENWRLAREWGQRQVDSVAALVEAASQPHTLRICSAADWHGETRFDCAEYGTWSAFDGESWDWQCERHANERPDWWNDDEDGEWSTSYEPDDGVIALAAALALLSRD